MFLMSDEFFFIYLLPEFFIQINLFFNGNFTNNQR